MSNDALASALSMTVVRLARHLRLRHDSETQTLSQFSALTVLHRDGSMTAGALAARERVTPASMSRVLDTLAAGDMITRTAHPADKRLTIITLTPAGTATITSAAAAREQWLHTELDQLPPDQYLTLADAARIIEQHPRHRRPPRLDELECARGVLQTANCCLPTTNRVVEVDYVSLPAIDK